MNPEQLQQAAQLLFAARTRGTLLERLPPPCEPMTSDEAYEIQRRVLALSGQSIGGWKVGAKSVDALPTCSPLPRDSLVSAPFELTDPPPSACWIEAEFAVVLGMDLPTRERPYTRGEIIAAVESYQPTIELVVSRFSDLAAQNSLSTLADSSSNLMLVCGASLTPFELNDLSQTAVEVFVDGKLRASTVGGNPARDPWRLLAWLANVGSRWAGGLRRGQVVTTGSCVGMLPVSTDTESVQIKVSGIGQSSLRFKSST